MFSCADGYEAFLARKVQVFLDSFKETYENENSMGWIIENELNSPGSWNKLYWKMIYKS